MTIQPQQMLVEERGLERQIKKLNLLIPTTADKKKDKFIFTATYLAEQLTSIVKDLEDIKYSIKSENNRILMHQFRANKERIEEDNANNQRVDAQVKRGK